MDIFYDSEYLVMWVDTIWYICGVVEAGVDTVPFAVWVSKLISNSEYRAIAIIIRLEILWSIVTRRYCSRNMDVGDNSSERQIR